MRRTATSEAHVAAIAARSATPGPSSSAGIRKWLALIPLVFLLAGCQVPQDEPEAEFVDLYADLKLVSLAFTHDMAKAGEMRRAVLARHGMTPAEFHEHFMHLAGRPEVWRSFQERVVARMDALREREFPTQDTTDSRKDGSHGR